MRELIDDRTVITRDSTHCACIFFRDANGMWQFPASWFSWTVAQDGSQYLMNTPPKTVPLDRTNGAAKPLKWCMVTAAMVH